MVDRARGFILQINEVDHCKLLIVQNALNALILSLLQICFALVLFHVMTYSVVYTEFL